MKKLTYGNDLNNDAYFGKNSEMLSTDDRLSSRAINRPILNLYNNEEEMYQVLQTTIKTVYGNKNGVVPDVYEEFNPNNITTGSFLLNTDKYLRVPTGLAFLRNDSTTDVASVGVNTGNPFSFKTTTKSNFYLEQDNESSSYADTLKKTEFTNDTFHSFSVFNRPNIHLAERELASLINLDLDDLNNDIKIYDSISSTGKIQYYLKIVENGTTTTQTNYLPNLASNTSWNLCVPASGTSNKYVQATGTYVAGTTYYTDSTGATTVDTSSFVAGTTSVAAYFVATNIDNTITIKIYSDSSKTTLLETLSYTTYVGASKSTNNKNLITYINNNSKYLTAVENVFYYPYYKYETSNSKIQTKYLEYASTPVSMKFYENNAGTYALSTDTSFDYTKTYYTYDDETGNYVAYVFNDYAVNNTSVNSTSLTATSYDGCVITLNSQNDGYFFDITDTASYSYVYERILSEKQKYYNSIFTLANEFLKKYSTSVIKQDSLGALLTLEPILKINDLLISSAGTDFIIYYNLKDDETLQNLDTTKRFGIASYDTASTNKGAPDGSIPIIKITIAKSDAGVYTVSNGTLLVDTYDKRTLYTKRAQMNSIRIDTRTDLVNYLWFKDAETNPKREIEVREDTDTNSKVATRITSPYLLLQDIKEDANQYFSIDSIGTINLVSHRNGSINIKNDNSVVGNSINVSVAKGDTNIQNTDGNINIKTSGSSNAINIGNTADASTNLISITGLTKVISSNESPLTVWRNSTAAPNTSMIFSSGASETKRGTIGFTIDDTFYVYNGSTNSPIITVADTVGNKSAVTYFDYNPATDETYSLSTSGTRFLNIFAKNVEFGTISISDRNLTNYNDKWLGALNLKNQNIFNVSSIYIAPTSIGSSTNANTLNFSNGTADASTNNTIYSPNSGDFYLVSKRTFGSAPSIVPTTTSFNSTYSSNGRCLVSITNEGNALVSNGLLVNGSVEINKENGNLNGFNLNSWKLVACAVSEVAVANTIYYDANGVAQKVSVGDNVSSLYKKTLVSGFVIASDNKTLTLNSSLTFTTSGSSLTFTHPSDTSNSTGGSITFESGSYQVQNIILNGYSLPAVYNSYSNNKTIDNTNNSLYGPLDGGYVYGQRNFLASTNSTTKHEPVWTNDSSFTANPLYMKNYEYETVAATYAAATGTYVSGTTYYTDSTGATTVDTSSFVAGTTSVVGYYVLSQAAQTTTIENCVFSDTKIFNAVWNDVADFIEVPYDIKTQYGKVYVLDDNGYHVSNKRNQKGLIGVASDTYGLSTGVKKGVNQVPIAVSGFVLAYVDDIYPTGTPLVSDKNGLITKASLFEKLFFSERIVGTFFKEEKQEKINNLVVVNGRSWIKVR